MEKTVGHKLLRRTARQRERRLTRLLNESRGDAAQRKELLTEFNLPVWTQGFKVESTVRGPFGWRVVATSDKGH